MHMNVQEYLLLYYKDSMPVYKILLNTYMLFLALVLYLSSLMHGHGLFKID